MREVTTTIPLQEQVRQYSSYNRFAAHKYRDEMLRYGEDARNISYEGIAAANIQPDESVLDAGCYDGDIGLYLVSEQGHQGQYVGLEPPMPVEGNEYFNVSGRKRTVSIQDDPRFMVTNEIAKRNKTKNIKFKLGYIESLPWADESFDVAIAYWSLHHLAPNDIEKGISELTRVLRPGGRLLIGANGISHKIVHHAILEEQKMALAPGTVFAGAFSKKFKLETVPAWISKFPELRFYDGVIRNTPMKITKETLPFYEASLDTYTTEFLSYRPTTKSYHHPSQEEWIRSRELSPTYQSLQKDISSQGYALDIINRGVFIYEKTHPAQEDETKPTIWLPTSSLRLSSLGAIELDLNS